ncbi:MAG: glucose-6-phosphate dehydrogenase [Anaerolineales bacterium]|nr:glucose-6-phosphate dehydrogenase [Anaerolineales bacterium]
MVHFAVPEPGQNPGNENQVMQHPATIIIFGASGDLTRRKLIPSLFDLYRKKQLHPDSQIIGISRTPFSDQEFREKLKASFTEFYAHTYDAKTWDQFSNHISYRSGDVTSRDDYLSLDSSLSQQKRKPDNRLYYLSLDPRFYQTVTDILGETGMTGEEEGWRRVIIEKPYGSNLKTAVALTSAIQRSFFENQIYRIDHYLGKDTVQNILIFRFANAIFEPVWNRNYIDKVEISVSETLGVGTRGSYYDKSGILRDMFQNHLLQLLTFIAMEPPIAFEADALRDEKVKVLRTLRPILGSQAREQTVRGQYTSGIINGKEVPAYRGEQGVPADSQTETFGEIKVLIDNWRWKSVPFYLSSGKRMGQKSTEIRIQFKCPPHFLFSPQLQECLSPNILTLSIQPDEGIHIQFLTKVPGGGLETRPVNLDFHYEPAFGAILPDAYERLLLDALLGDASLFMRADEIELAWSWIDPILQAWQDGQGPELEFYPAGINGLLAGSQILHNPTLLANPG